MKIKSKLSKILIFTFLIPAFSFAGEGMWLPLFLKSLNEAEMQEMGMKISAEDIYSTNHSSLKDAIVHFGGFCTAEIISDKGLLLTNHHCGYGEIQAHSTLEKNYLDDGFWAKTNDEELPNPGLFVTFIDRIDDVTEAALKGTDDGMSLKQRQRIIDRNLEEIKKTYTPGEFHDVVIRPFYYGNQYFAFLTTTFKDVRLVGTPPQSIGKFGADTDNWVFPRHTGDFSLFRIYAGPDNEPAEYSKENKPYVPKHFLPISMDGVEEGDFTMVFGFPGRTQQYLPSPAVEQIIEIRNPAKIHIRDIALKIMDKHMKANPSIRLKYASKFASIANYWKKWIGESTGLKSTNALEKKRTYETKFLKYGPQYRGLLQAFDNEYNSLAPYAKARDMYSETALRNVEILRQMANLRRLVKYYKTQGETGYNDFLSRLKPYLTRFFKNYNIAVDREIFDALIENYIKNLDAEYVPDFLRGDIKGLTKIVFDQSKLKTEEGVMNAFALPAIDAITVIKNDALYQFADKWHRFYTEHIATPYNGHQRVIDSLQRLYMKAQMEVIKDKRFWPDANSTMRITYGKVKGYTPRDGVVYLSHSTTKGIREKYKKGDYEFDVPEKLLRLIDNKDFGPYVDKSGQVPVCFLGTNHTTGGNSGSPVIDAYGNLVGLNFDRVWEGTMSDINYDASICRNIMVDTRYILFIIDKFAGAKRLIDEMSLVNPKRENPKLKVKKKKSCWLFGGH